MPEEPDEAVDLDGELQELVRLVELLDKAAANVRQLVYRVRPVLRARVKSEAKPARTNSHRERQGKRRDDST